MSNLLLSSPDVELDPEEARVGQLVSLSGSGFMANGLVTVTISHSGGAFFRVQLRTDAVGNFASVAPAKPASVLLSSDGDNVSADDTVTIDDLTYTFKASIDEESAAREVLVGEYAAESLINLADAIEAQEESWGTTYSLATEPHTTVQVAAVDVMSIRLVAMAEGTSGNGLEVSEGTTTLSFSDTELSGGEEVSDQNLLEFAPSTDGVWNITASDEFNTVSHGFRVWHST